MDLGQVSRHLSSLTSKRGSVSDQTEERGATTELFRSENLVVRRVGGFSRDACVVTFDSFTDTRTLGRPGFGQGFLHSREIDAIHVIARENDWYQYAEMGDAMATVHAATRDYHRVVTYGSSMGAYAAIRLAGLAGAHAIVALSPQYSIDPKIVPFEYRWEEPSRRFQAVWERTLPYPDVEDAYVAYDPDNLDIKHLALFDQQFRFTHVRLPGAGHPVTGYLVELDLLEGMVQQACRGAIDVPALQEAAWAGRERSPQYFAVKATRVKDRTKRIELLEEAVRLAPNNPDVRCRLGLQLGKAGRFVEAEEAHRAALEIAPGHTNLLLHYSYTVERRGDLAGALAIMEEVVANSGGASLYLSRLGWLRARVAGQRVPKMRWWRKWWMRLLGRGHSRSISAGR